MKKKPVFWGLAITFFVAIFAGLVFLPAILSADMLKARLLQEISRRLPGRLQVEQWEFKWFGGMEAQGIRYDLRQQNLLVKIASLKVYRGLIGLIADPRNLGAIEVVEPQAVFLPQDQPSKKPSERVGSSQAAALPAFAGLLKITDGSIRSVKPDRSEKTVVRELDLFVDLSDVAKPVSYRFFLIAGDNLGRFTGEGTMTLPADDAFNLSRIQSDARLKISNWELEEVMGLLASRRDYPSGKGRLDADVALRGSFSEDLDITGKLSTDRLELWGGPLGADHPVIHKIDVQLDATITRDLLSLRQFGFQSSLAKGSTQGTFSAGGQRQLQGSAEIDLAEVFSEMPHLLKLRRDTALSEGKLKISAGLATSDGTTVFEGSARINSLKGFSRGKTITLNQPVGLKARGEMRAEGIWLDALSLRSSFINADGRGDLNHLQATLSADLAAALRELKKFIDLNQWDGSGQLFAKLQLDKTSPELNSGSLNLEIRHLALSRKGQPIVVQQDLNASLTAGIEQGEHLTASGNINLDLKMLLPYLQKIAGPQISISGKGDNPFKFKTVSQGARWADSLKQTDFSGAIRADAIDAFGVNISKTEVPIRIADASAVAELSAAANGGRLNLQPSIDLQKTPYVLSLPQNSHILQDVEITDAVAEKLISKIHPVFGGPVRAEGFVDLYMQHFNWPLDKESRDNATFAGKLRLKGLRLQSTRLLAGLLGLIGIRGNEMDFGNLDIDFVARNGRIETSPIRFKIDGYPIALHGSMGFDKSLDYTATLPITSMLVGDKAYRYLEGLTIDVPIRGSSSNPDIDKATMQKTSADMARQALQKTLEKGVQNIFEQMIKKKQ